MIQERLFALRDEKYREFQRSLIPGLPRENIIGIRIPAMRKLAKECLDCWHEYNISPKPGMEKVVRDLKAKGYRMYVCSNASLRFRVFQNEIPGFSLMEGALVSAEEKLLKPDPAIYRRLFEKFDIRPEESFFIDDIQENIDGAKACGMDGYCFADGDVEKLREELGI